MPIHSEFFGYHLIKGLLNITNFDYEILTFLTPILLGRVHHLHRCHDRALHGHEQKRGDQIDG